MIRHVLLDGDGVLQRIPGGWRHALAPYVGERVEELMADLFALEQPCLVGEADFHDVLAALFDTYAVPHDVDEVFAAVWQRIEVADTTRPLVGALRALPVGVHLATNQTAGRAAYMRSWLGYDDLLDRSYYSCDLGVAKPTAAYFAAVLADLGADAAEVLLVDDSEANVVAARELGLAAEQWHLGEGLLRLRVLLEGHGLQV